MSMGGDLLRYEPVRRSFEVSSSSAHKVHHHHHHQHQLQQQQDSSSSQLDDDSNGQMELSSEEEGETVMDSAVKAGADLVLAKPLKISVVERALDEVLGPQWRQGSSALSSSSCFSSKNSTFSELSPAAPGPTPPSTTTTMEADEWCQLNSLRGSVGDLTLLNE